MQLKRDAHNITCREWFNFVETGKTANESELNDFRAVVFELPYIDMDLLKLWLQATILASQASINVIDNKIALSRADNAFSDYIKETKDYFFEVEYFVQVQNFAQMAKDKFNLNLVASKKEFFSIWHILSEYPIFEQAKETFIFFLFRTKKAKIKSASEQINAIRKTYNNLPLWIIDRCNIYDPSRITGEKRDYFKEFYSVKNATKADISVDKTSIYEYNNLISVLSKK